MDCKKQLLKDYPILNDANNNGDITWTDPQLILQPNGDIMWKFNIKIKNNCILNWFEDDFLSKPIDQRGSATDTDLSSPKREQWIRCWFSELGGLQTSPFVFSFSNQWEDAFLSNGGHRVNFSSRMLNPLEVIQNIDFDLPFTFINIEGNGKPKTVNLKGCKSLVEIKKKIGLRNWNNIINNSEHSVDLYYFNYKTEDLARKAHSEVFLYSNDNLPAIDKIHSIWSDVNNLVRPVSDWLGYENDTILQVFKDIWTKKKVYNESKPYELILKSLKFWKDGFSNTSKNDIQEFTLNTPMTKKEFTQFKTDFSEAMKLYIEQNKLNSSKFSYNFTRMFEYFCVYMFAVSKRKRVWKKNQYLVVDDYVNGIDDAITELLKESTDAGEGKETYHYNRSTSSTEEGLLEVVRKVLGKLILNKVIVERDPRRNITKAQKSLMGNDCDILGVQVLQSDNEYHHIYKFHSQGGKSDTENVVRCSAEVNQYINKGGFKTTSDAIKSMLKDKDWVVKFSDDKLEYWKNGGMEDLIQKENDDKYLYQSYDNLIELDTNDLGNYPHTFIEVKI